MNDADGSSGAALGAHDDPEERPRGFLSRLKFWKKPDHNGEAITFDPMAMKSAAPLEEQRPGLSNLRRMRIEDVAIPKGEIVAVPVETGLEELLAAFRDSGFTRLPVFDGTLDMPLGMIHLKDVALKFGFNGPVDGFDMRPMLRPLLFAPPSMPIGVLLQKMQSQRVHMALVIDEYGGTDGLVTIEDLIEQVIGEIEDEHDVEEEEPWTLESPGVYLVLSRTPLVDFEQEIGMKLTDPEIEEEAESLGGLVFLMTGRVPARGEILPHPEGLEIEVVDADPRSIKRLRVRLPGSAAKKSA